MDPTTSRAELDRVTVRFAGDSGDGLQVVGSQLTNTSAVFGNDLLRRCPTTRRRSALRQARCRG